MFKKKSKEKLIINRKEWLRGEGAGHSFLIRESDNKKCCLGFDLLRRGFTEQEVIGRKTPNELKLKISGLTKGTLWITNPEIITTDVCDELMLTNDAYYVSEDTRERNIKYLFEKIDIEVEFI